MWRHLTLVLLLGCVPAQYFVTKLFTSRGSTYYLQKTFSSLDDALNLEKWSSWPQQLIRCARRFIFDFPVEDEKEAENSDQNSEEKTADSQTTPDQPKNLETAPERESENEPAEIDDGFDEKVHFGASRKPRSPRHPEVIFHVGQTVTHKKHKYRGVIVAWDVRPLVPPRVESSLFPKNKPEIRNQPFFTILIDTRDRVVPQMDYAPQDAIEVKPYLTIAHPVLLEYFQSFHPDPETGFYEMRPHLREVFPED